MRRNPIASELGITRVHGLFKFEQAPTEERVKRATQRDRETETAKSHRQRTRSICRVYKPNSRGTILYPPASSSNPRSSSSPDPSFQRPFSGKPFKDREWKKERRVRLSRDRENTRRKSYKSLTSYTMPLTSSL